MKGQTKDTHSIKVHAIHSVLRLDAKGQLISKKKCQAKDSSEKRTNEFVFTSMRLVFVRFLEEIDDLKKPFRN